MVRVSCPLLDKLGIALLKGLGAVAGLVVEWRWHIVLDELLIERAVVIVE